MLYLLLAVLGVLTACGGVVPVGAPDARVDASPEAGDVAPGADAAADDGSALDAAPEAAAPDVGAVDAMAADVTLEAASDGPITAGDGAADAADACVSMTPGNCCGVACATPSHGAATCVAGVCGLACDAGYADCDGVAANGCEVNLNADDTAHCGGCTTSCTVGWACCAGHCANIAADLDHCGRCDASCGHQTWPHLATVCVAGDAGTSGPCSAACDPGYVNCDGEISNGCETHVADDVSNCGGCFGAGGAQCARGHSCIDGRCR